MTEPAPPLGRSDPSALTTAQLWREIASLKELLEARIEAVEKSITIAHADLVRVPTDVQKQVGNLRDLHDTKFVELEKRLVQKFQDTQTAIIKAEMSNEKRLDAINNFNAQLREQQVTFMPRKEAEKSIDANSDKIATLAARIDRTEGRSGGLNAGWGYLVGAVGLLGAIAGLIVIVITLRG